MSPEYVILFLTVGAAAGLLARHMMTEAGYGLTGDLMGGAIGSYVGVSALGVAGISTGGLLTLLAAAILGSLAVLHTLRLVRHRLAT